ncbi:two-component sensor histidine kinase [Streptomyces cavourensis]|jgi:C4-dicarboxylate-specific signal transduction histidine kinase|uniref:sensor histidine kinase n=1 Tax=unclassified Achromobacter TaxID=2626865 RepID=UPI000E0319F1|nr:two-component sensor histidine kinase [Streptomyces cavourensis]
MFQKPARYLKQRPGAGVALLVVLMALVFLADTFTRLEIAVAVFYVAVILAAFSFLPRRGVTLVAVACAVLTLLSLYLTPNGGALRELGVINALISIAAIGVTAYLALKRAAAEDAAFEARTQLARMARIHSLGELTASIAHEINQPLAAIATSGSACQRWLEHDPPNIERALRALQRMTDDVSRASEVVARIRRDARNATPQRERLDLADVIGDVLELAGGELASHEVALSTRIQERVPAVLGDRVQLGQVVVNLVLNAVEAMQETPVGARHLTLRLTLQAPGLVQCSVTDSGPGLSPQARERLFDTFWTTKPDGTGLGLTISRGIIEGHGGRLWAEPAARGGAVFCFTLPAAAEEESP